MSLGGMSILLQMCVDEILLVVWVSKDYLAETQ